MVNSSELIASWVRDKKAFSMAIVPVRNVSLAPNQNLDITGAPQGKPLKGEEGTIFFGIAVFTSPLCGVRLELPYYDSRNHIRVDRFLGGSVIEPNEKVYAKGPPETPSYVIVVTQEFMWNGWAKIHIFNEDTTTQTCLYYNYFAAYRRKSRSALGTSEDE